MDLLRLKLDTYSEKIKEIFNTHVERPNSDSEGEEVNIPKDKFVVRISRLQRVFNDLGTFVGLAFNHFNSFLANFYDTKKTEKNIVLLAQHYMWLRNHKENIEKERNYPTKDKPFKKKGDSILKSSSSNRP